MHVRTLPMNHLHTNRRITAYRSSPGQKDGEIQMDGWTDPGQDDVLHVLHDAAPVLRLKRSAAGQQRTHETRLNVWNDPPLTDPCEILLDKIHHLLPYTHTHTHTHMHTRTYTHTHTHAHTHNKGNKSANTVRSSL